MQSPLPSGASRRGGCRLGAEPGATVSFTGRGQGQRRADRRPQERGLVDCGAGRCGSEAGSDERSGTPLASVQGVSGRIGGIAHGTDALVVRPGSPGRHRLTGIFRSKPLSRSSLAGQRRLVRVVRTGAFCPCMKARCGVLRPASGPIAPCRIISSAPRHGRGALPAGARTPQRTRLRPPGPCHPGAGAGMVRALPAT